MFTKLTARELYKQETKEILKKKQGKGLNLLNISRFNAHFQV